MDDGEAALRASLQSGIRAPRPLSLDRTHKGQHPGALAGTAIRIEYADSRGQISFRWITVNSVDAGQPVILNAYCWVRREIRTFRADRVVSVSDMDGEVWPAKAFFAAFGIKAKPPQWSKPAGSFSKGAVFIPSGGTGSFAKLAAAEATLRSEDTPSKPSRKRKTIVHLILWAAIGGGLLYLLV